MSLKKKEQLTSSGLRVAANDPHLVSLGGGRLSTAVTIHYLPVGDMTIGSSPDCNISLNGSGVKPLHCTVYRSEEGEVTIVPETDARILIDGNKINTETNLTQGAMLTIGNSNYLRFNNPAEAQLIKSTIGSNERISMPQIDFVQDKNCSNRDITKDLVNSFHETFESQILRKQNNETILNKVTKTDYININNFHSPKVFTADSITVNAPAKDVLGPKYANFAKNLAENHKNDKNCFTKNNEVNLKSNNYVNIPSSFIQNSPNTNEVLAKVNNVASRNQTITPTTYDRYPKPGIYGGLQLFPMNGINMEINTNNSNNQEYSQNYEQLDKAQNKEKYSKISPQEQERIDEILKICAEYDRQNQSLQSSPIVQNRIKTNGSLPREKKSPFYDLSPQPIHHSKTFFPDKTKVNSGYENVRITTDRRVEIGACSSTQKTLSSYENVVVGKYLPQSPRTKIRTTCASPKRDTNVAHPPVNHNQNDYTHLIQSFEEKLKLEMQAIKEAGRLRECNSVPEKNEVPRKRENRNINNLTLNLNMNSENGQKVSDQIDSSKKQDESKITNGEEDLTSTITDGNEDSLEDLKRSREEVLNNVRKLKTQIADLRRQEDEVLRELDMEKALVCAEQSTTNANLLEMEKNFTTLQAKIHRLEAQRNANRVMQETQQAKLKQAIEMKQESLLRMQRLVEENPTDESLKEELDKNMDSLENDKKTFEDLEFQYLEEETEWLAYREDLHTDLKLLSKSIEEKRNLLLHLENQKYETHNSACQDTKSLEYNLLSLLKALEKNRQELHGIDKKIFEITGQQQNQTDSEDDDIYLGQSNGNLNTSMSQSLFGSTEILYPKPKDNNIMSRSVNENMFSTNIEMPSQKDCTAAATSTPRKDGIIFTEFKDIDITPEVVRREHNDEKDPILKLKYNVKSMQDDQQMKVNLNLTLGKDDFEVNPLEKRVASQDDIDRICKVTSDAPISTKGASNKIYASIREIERNRQLLLAQQGSHVIEHERQKMQELKKKSHDEARALYLSTQNSPKEDIGSKRTSLEGESKEKYGNSPSELLALTGKENKQKNEIERGPNQQRYSHPELESQQTRPLSEANSEISYDNLSEKGYKSINDLANSSNRLSDDSGDAKRCSINSNNTIEGDKLLGGNKRNLPKHQRPLTRYLPIMSPDLDLRLHIESAGHQITLCPHVFIDKYSCRGYLHKLGATFHGWSRRWFVLDRQKCAFIYYSDKSEKKPRGGAYFSTIEEVYLDHLNTSKSGRPHCTFIVKTKKRSYHLMAASDAAARIWIDAIITGAQGNVDY